MFLDVLFRRGCYPSAFGCGTWPLDATAQLFGHGHAELLAHVAHHVQRQLAVGWILGIRQRLGHAAQASIARACTAGELLTCRWALRTVPAGLRACQSSRGIRRVPRVVDRVAMALMPRSWSRAAKRSRQRCRSALRGFKRTPSRRSDLTVRCTCGESVSSCSTKTYLWPSKVSRANSRVASRT